MPLEAGSRLGAYDIIAPLGAGGMGEVYRARDAALKRDVAIKVLPASWLRDPERLRRFELEAQAAAALNHPNIVSIFHIGDHDGAPYIVTELLQGEPLSERLMRGPMPAREVIAVGTAIAQGLAAAHAAGIVHRDLKPDNIFLCKDGRVKILDFGLAKLSQPQSQTASVEGNTVSSRENTATGQIMGTVGYMSPEQVRSKPADARSDIFALGVILYEMLTGKRAFRKDTPAETMAAILNEDPPPMSQLSQNLSPGLQRIISRCLMKNPEQRFQHASDVAFALEALSESGSTAPPVYSGTGPRARTWLGIGVGVAALVIVAVLLVSFIGGSGVPSVASITQLTNDGQPKELPFLTDGSRIYFNEGSHRSYRIAQVAIDGGPIAFIPTTIPVPKIIGLAPRGSALLIHASGEQGIMGPLYELPLPAGSPRPLQGMQGSEGSYTPDGRILVSQEDSLLIADADGSNPRKLVSGVKAFINEPSMSPDGRRIAFTLDRSPTVDTAWGVTLPAIFVGNSDGTSFHAVMDGKGSDWVCCAGWTADSKDLIVTKVRGRNADLWLVPVSRGFFSRLRQPVQLTNGPLAYVGATVTPDGKQVLTSGMRPRGELARYDLATKQFVPFLSGISVFSPTFSNDGQWVAYTSYPDNTLWRSRSDGTDRLQLTFPPAEVVYPFISPDGKQVAYQTSDSVGGYVISMDGGTPQKVINTPIAAANWSPDGNSLVYNDVSVGWNHPHMKMIDLRTGKITPLPGEQIGPQWIAPDKIIAESAGFKNFQIFDLATGKWTDLPNPDPSPVINWAHSPDFKYFYYTTGGQDPKIFRFRVSDLKIEPVGNLKDFPLARGPDYNTQITVAPDGSPLFTREVGTQEIYALGVRWP